jgi:hypothetical protein
LNKLFIFFSNGVHLSILKLLFFQIFYWTIWVYKPPVFRILEVVS